MRLFFVIIPALLTLVASPARSDGVVVGVATVIDGSALKVQGTLIHLFGVMAPGLKQTCELGITPWPCGEKAAEKLTALIEKRQVRCGEVEREPNGTPLAVCFAGETELNRAMVSAGYAVVRWTSGLDYSEEQAIAKAAAQGVWAGTFEDPWTWRKKHESVAQARPAG